MLRFLQCASIFALACLFLGSAAARPDCRQESLVRLQGSAPDGFAIYRQITDKAFFFSWLDCDDGQFDLSTAVHESTHFITGETDAFPLVSGGTVARPHEVSAFFPPAAIARNFKADDFSGIYLRRGKASSATDFLYLLDELNAYSHDLATAVALKDLSNPDQAVDHRDGLAALMAFVATYAETARAAEPGTAEAETWRGLRTPRVARTIAAIWGRAERVMASSCGIPNFGNLDKAYIRRSCAAGAQAAMSDILGRPPVCPEACLTPDVAQASLGR